MDLGGGDIFGHNECIKLSRSRGLTDLHQRVIREIRAIRCLHIRLTIQDMTTRSIRCINIYGAQREVMVSLRK